MIALQKNRIINMELIVNYTKYVFINILKVLDVRGNVKNLKKLPTTALKTVSITSSNVEWHTH